MNLNERIVGALFVALMVIGFQALVYGSEETQHPLPGNDYVLRSCMSSVELKRRNVDGAKSSLPASPNGSRTSAFPAIRSPMRRYPGKSAGTKARERSRQRSDQRVLRRERPAEEMIADTPLTTLNVERRGRKSGPQIFVKKEQLPEVESSVGGRVDEKKEAPIIVIESARLFPSAR